MSAPSRSIWYSFDCTFLLDLSPVVFVCWITQTQGWLFSFSGSKRFSPVKKLRCSVVLKAHSPLLWLHPLASAPSNGAQLPGAINEGQAKCHCRRTGNVQRTGKDMQRTMCKEWNGSRSFFWQAFTHWLAFSLLPQEFFSEFCCSEVGMPFHKHPD